ncbi:MAG: hypothetical protein ACTSQ8_21075 [Candidatus Helarchaeota archaeon]
MANLRVSITGASSSGKSTLLNGLSNILGRDNVTHVDMDGYHFHTREERLALNEFPDEPKANDFNKLIADLKALSSGNSILMPTYNHTHGEFGKPIIIYPQKYIIVEGLHAILINTIAEKKMIDFSIFIYPDEDLRRSWKIKRDVNKRGYSFAIALEQIYKRENYVNKYINPQIFLSDCIFLIEKNQRNELVYKLLFTRDMKDKISFLRYAQRNLIFEFDKRNIRNKDFYELKYDYEKYIIEILPEIQKKNKLSVGEIPKLTMFNNSYTNTVYLLAFLISQFNLFQGRGSNI